MFYLLKHALTHLLLLLFLALLTEVGLSLFDSYQSDTQDFQLRPFQLNQAINSFFQKIILMDFASLTTFQWAKWVCLERPYLLAIVLILLIVYYNYRQTQLKEPHIVAHPKVSPGIHASRTRDYTARKVRELQESEEYKKYKRDKQMGRLKEVEDDDTVAELRQKEERIFQ